MIVASHKDARRAFGKRGVCAEPAASPSRRFARFSLTCIE